MVQVDGDRGAGRTVTPYRHATGPPPQPAGANPRGPDYPDARPGIGGHVKALASAVVAALLVGSGTVAVAQTNTAVAVNTRDGSKVLRLAFSVRRVVSDTVDPVNAAAAASSCDACLTLAAAIQVVLVAGDPEVVAPENLALAVNVDCTSCDTAALAYQFVLGGTSVPDRYPREFRRAVAELRSRFHRLRAQDLTLDEFVTEVETIQGELRDLIQATFFTPDPASDPSTTSTSTSTTAPASASDPEETTTTADTSTTTTTEAGAGAPSTTSTSAP